MMVVGDAEDVHVQCVLLLCMPRDLVLSREYMLKKLLSILVLHYHRQEAQRTHCICLWTLPFTQRRANRLKY